MHHPPSQRYYRRRKKGYKNNTNQNVSSEPILKGMPRRIKNLKDVLSLEQWTSNAPVASSIILTVHWKVPNYSLNLNLPYVREVLI